MWVATTDTLVNLANACSVDVEGGLLVAHMVDGETVTLGDERAFGPLRWLLVHQERAADIDVLEERARVDSSAASEAL